MAKKGLPPVFLNINYVKEIRKYIHYSQFDPMWLYRVENNKFYKKKLGTDVYYVFLSKFNLKSFSLQ
jgi:hypothetical protein